MTHHSLQQLCEWYPFPGQPCFDVIWDGCVRKYFKCGSVLSGNLQSVSHVTFKLGHTYLVTRVWLFRYMMLASKHADFQMIPYESAAHSRGYEHASRIVGEEGCVRQRRVTPTPPATPSPPGDQRCQ